MSEDEKWGFTDKKSGWPTETKAGVAIMLLLVGAFGFIAWTKYGNGANTLASIQGQGGDTVAEAGDEPNPPDDGGGAIPTGFDQPTEPGRIAANESEFLNGQAEPMGSGTEEWNPTTPEPPVATASPTAGQATLSPDTFEGFSDPAPPPPAAAEPTPAQNVATSEPAGSATFDGGFEDNSGVFATEPAAPAQIQQPVAAATSQDSGDGFSWGGEPDFAAKTETPTNTFDPTPAPAPKPQPAAVQPVDDFGGFGDEPVAKAAPAPTGGFGDDIFADDLAPAPAPAPAATGRSTVGFEPQQPEPKTTVVSQPNPIRQSDPDPFETANATNTQIDFNDTPAPSRDIFESEPQRYDRDAPRQTQRVVTERQVPRPQPRSRTASRTNDQTYVVRDGETYWSISKTVYGSARYYKALSLYNKRRVPDPRKMRPGIELLVPTTAVLEQQYPNLFPRVRSVSRTSSFDIDDRQRVGLSENSKGQPVYRVGNGDNLGQIALKHLGHEGRWTDIYNLNKSQLSSPRALKPGMLLLMPANTSQISYR